MKWSLLICAAACAASAPLFAHPSAAHPDFSGDWTLNRAASDFPTEVGFDPDWQDSGSATPARGGSGSGGRSGGGRGGRGGGGGRPGASGAVPSTKPRFESEDDVKKIRQLIEEVKSPPPTLTIVQTDAAVTMTFGRAPTRTFHPNGKEETLHLDAGGVGVVTKWDASQLVIRLLVEKDRELRYTLSGGAQAGQLVMQAQFAEKNRGEVIRRVYDVAK